jgi:predicted permease
MNLRAICIVHMCVIDGSQSTESLMYCRRFLSGLVMNVFTPALLFSKLGASGTTLTSVCTRAHSSPCLVSQMLLRSCAYALGVRATGRAMHSSTSFPSM